MLFFRTFRSTPVIHLGVLILALGLSLSVTSVSAQTPITKSIPLVCSNSDTADLLEVSYELTATPLGDVIEGQDVTIQFTGVGNFSAALLNGALPYMFTGLYELKADAMNATVAVRSGATGGSPILLHPTVSLPVEFPIPISHDPACAAAGLPDPCVLEPIVLPLTTGSATFTPDAAGTDILVGWDESYLPPNEPSWSVSNPPGPNGARASIQPLFPNVWKKMGLECYMARLDGGVAVPLDDSELLAIPVESLTGVDDHLPSQLVLSSYPNPFNPMTTVSYTIPESGNVRLDVYTARGALVKNLVNEYREAGTYGISWNGTDRSGKKMPSGVYFLKISSKAGSKSSKIVMVR